MNDIVEVGEATAQEKNMIEIMQMADSLSMQIKEDSTKTPILTSK